ARHVARDLAADGAPERLAAALEIEIARRRAEDEPRGHRQAHACHLVQTGALASQQFLQPAVPFRSSPSEEIDVSTPHQRPGSGGRAAAPPARAVAGLSRCTTISEKSPTRRNRDPIECRIASRLSRSRWSSAITSTSSKNRP